MLFRSIGLAQRLLFGGVAGLPEPARPGSRAREVGSRRSAVDFCVATTIFLRLWQNVGWCQRKPVHCVPGLMGSPTCTRIIARAGIVGSVYRTFPLCADTEVPDKQRRTIQRRNGSRVVRVIARPTSGAPRVPVRAAVANVPGESGWIPILPSQRVSPATRRGDWSKIGRAHV